MASSVIRTSFESRCFFLILFGASEDIPVNSLCPFRIPGSEIAVFPRPLWLLAIWVFRVGLHEMASIPPIR